MATSPKRGSVLPDSPSTSRYVPEPTNSSRSTSTSRSNSSRRGGGTPARSEKDLSSRSPARSEKDISSRSNSAKRGSKSEKEASTSEKEAVSSLYSKTVKRFSMTNADTGTQKLQSLNVPQRRISSRSTSRSRGSILNGITVNTELMNAVESIPMMYVTPESLEKTVSKAALRMTSSTEKTKSFVENDQKNTPMLIPEKNDQDKLNKSIDDEKIRKTSDDDIDKYLLKRFRSKSISDSHVNVEKDKNIDLLPLLNRQISDIGTKDAEGEIEPSELSVPLFTITKSAKLIREDNSGSVTDLKERILRRSTLRIKNFLIGCHELAGLKFNVNYIKRFLRRVVQIQRIWREFLACKNERLTSLIKLWDFYEYAYMSRIVRVLVNKGDGKKKVNADLYAYKYSACHNIPDPAAEEKKK